MPCKFSGPTAFFGSFGSVGSLASARFLAFVSSSAHLGALRFPGGLVFKALRLWYHSTLGLRVIKKRISALRATRYGICQQMRRIKLFPCCSFQNRKRMLWILNTRQTPWMQTHPPYESVSSYEHPAVAERTVKIVNGPISQFCHRNTNASTQRRRKYCCVSRTNAYEQAHRGECE